MPRLLLLEDDVDTRDMLAMLLEHGGFEVVATGTSHAAVNALSKETFDAVLADLLVDSANLAESWKMIADLVQLADPTPLGLLTGWPVTNDQLSDHGVVFAIAKPFTSEILLEQIARALKLPPLSASREAKLRRYFEAIEGSDWHALTELCTDDVVYHLPGSDPRFARSIRGLEAFVRYTQETFARFVDPRFQIDEIRSVQRGGIVRYRGSWRDDQGVTEMPGAVLFVFEGDRIAQIGVRVDVSSLRTAPS
jgi:CheY-like chemotaxis protein/ketosteroid isomerase-like protein